MIGTCTSCEQRNVSVRRCPCGCCGDCYLCDICRDAHIESEDCIVEHLESLKEADDV